LFKKILTGGIWATVVKGFSLPLNLAVLALLARLIPPAEMGVYFLAFSIVTAVSILSMLGMGETIVRLVASSIAIKHFHTVRKAVKHAFLWGFLGAVVGAIVVYFLGTQFGLPTYIVLLVSIWGIAQTFVNLLAEALRGFNDIRAATILKNRSVVNAIVAGVLFIVLLLQIKVDLETVIILIVAAGLISIVLGGILLWNNLTRLDDNNEYADDQDDLNIFSQALPVMGINTMSIIRAQIGLWIIASLLTAEEVALFGSATRLVYMVSISLNTIVNAMIPPIIAELYVKHDIVKLEETVRTLATIASMFALIATIIFILGGRFILGLVYGEFYTGAWVVLSILALGQFVDVMGGSGGVTLIMTGHQDTMMKITVFTAVLAVLVTIVGAQYWGMTGVAVATAFALVIQNILMVTSAKKKVGIWTHVKLSWSR
jgi:O-antigen/teichoic acid export membrane protein